MEIGIGLPSTIPGVERRQVLDWARGAEQSGFSTLGVVDRIVYGNWDSLVTLAAVAAVTERIRLTTAILIAPLRSNTAELAKQAATIDRLSEGRLVLGAAVGVREDDFEASGVSPRTRGRRFDDQLDELRRIWGGERRGFAGAIGPRPARPEGPPLIIGGRVEASFERAARAGNGWIAGGGGPDAFRQGADAATAAWQRAGRDGAPRLLALSYYSLGDDARAQADSYIHDYYGFAGPYADRIAATVATDADAIRSQQHDFEAAGCDELIWFPCSPDPHQVELLARAAVRG